MECSKKKKFRTKKEALKFGRRRRLSRISGRVRAYFCPICKNFHLTSTSFGKKR